MNVLLPYPDFQRSVQCLDTLRLRNQVLRECKTLLSGGWPHHPAARLWAEHKAALILYALDGLDELKKRGFDYFVKAQEFIAMDDGKGSLENPPLVSNSGFHSAYRSQLLQKEIDDLTWLEWKSRGLHETGRLPRLKSKWRKHSPSKPRPVLYDDFELARLGMGYYPKPIHYAQFGWTEEPGAIPYIWSPCEATLREATLETQ